MEIKELELHANNIRKNILTEVYSANSGHPGGSLSGADILTEIYFEQMDINKDNVDSIDRDRKSTRLNSSHTQKSRMPSSA